MVAGWSSTISRSEPPLDNLEIYSLHRLEGVAAGAVDAAQPAAGNHGVHRPTRCLLICGWDGADFAGPAFMMSWWKPASGRPALGWIGRLL